MRRAWLGLVVFFLGTLPGLADNWPAWRGPHGNGVSDDRQAPVHWGPDKNVRWKVALPEPGNSTPIVWQDRVFLTQSLEKGQRRALVAYDRRSGARLWQEEVACPVTEPTNWQHNPPCSASAVTDGEAVYAHFGSAGVLACNLEGKRLWHRELGPVVHKFGNGASPVLYKDLLFVYQGPGEPTFLTALDKRTGKIVWKRDEVGVDNNIFGSWSTPIVVRAGQRDELVMALPGDRIGGEGELKAYDPRTGDVLWRCRGLAGIKGNEIYASPALSSDGKCIIAISGHNGATIAVRPGGAGDVTASHRLWRLAERIPQRVGSGVVHNGLLYLADGDGYAECLEVDSGKLVWKEKLGGTLWGSMLLAAGKLYVSNLEGQTFVLAAGNKFKLLADNDLKEPLYAAPALADGELFLRTHRHLYCIAER